MHAFKVGGLAVVLWLAVASSAGAQGVAESFQELRLLTRAGETISVVRQDGQELTGQIAELSPVRLRLLVAGGPRDLAESDVRLIWQRRADSLKDGALWGFGIGAGFGFATGLYGSYYSEGIQISWALAWAGISGGVGASIGMGIDTLVRRREVIYASAGASVTTLTVLPILTPTRQGGALSLRF